MTMTETTTIADIARALPSSVRVFQRYGIDFCCGGKKAIGAVCRERNIDFTEIADAIDASRAAPDAPRDWSQEALGTIVDYILTTYHEPLRDELPRLQAMATKVAQVHGANTPRLSRIEAVVNELSADLETHMHKEELVLFPAVRALESGAGRAISVAAPIAVMEHEHERAGGLLAELRSLTDDYQPPAWGCATWRALYHGLSELEAAMHLHVHLENNVLFPRALGLVEG